jgi:hypothetical protein
MKPGFILFSMRKIILASLLVFFLIISVSAVQCTGVQHLTNNCVNEIVELDCPTFFENNTVTVPNYNQCIWNVTNGCITGVSCDYDI